MGCPVIEVAGNEATALSCSCVFRPENERFYPWRVSANLWRLVCRDERWHIESRTNRLMTGSVAAQALLRTIDQLAGM
jgi:hypothetical protein